MVVVAKKKPTPEPIPEAPESKPPQHPLRFEDDQLPAALDDYAKSIRRSRNMTIILLLEEILGSKGFWPRKPKKD